MYYIYRRPPTVTGNKNAFNNDNARKVRPRDRWAETTPFFSVTGQPFLNRYFRSSTTWDYLRLYTFVAKDHSARRMASQQCLKRGNLSRPLLWSFSGILYDISGVSTTCRALRPSWRGYTTKLRAVSSSALLNSIRYFRFRVTLLMRY